MKVNKIIAGVMAVCVMGFGVPYVNAVAENNSVITASAEDEANYTEGTYELLKYKNYGDYIEIYRCDKSAKKVVIPSEIEGVPVTSIGDETFWGCSSLTSIEIPNGVTSIGVGAFADCSSLTSIEIPDSVISIGGCAFSSCTGLTSINIPNSMTTIESGMFSCCENLKLITIPNSINNIGWLAFAGCSELSVTILNPDCDICDVRGTMCVATIYGYENSTAQAYAEKYGRSFVSLGKAPEKETATGDMNGDNSVNIADAVFLQNCILGKQELTEEQFKNADINSDGFVDSFDMVLIRCMIIENNK